ncbi:MAG: hypothetical protein HUU54_08455 [Ignavibacteriaceae bacterium]|nr:hypothetical protein [Ignavibacteriaceae bacterium]
MLKFVHKNIYSVLNDKFVISTKGWMGIPVISGTPAYAGNEQNKATYPRNLI